MTGAAPRRRAVVFAYHNVGVRCLRVLLDAGVDVALVVTHEDSAGENIWFGSVLATARREGLSVATPASPNTPEFVARIASLAPDFIFSFYYRQMLGESVLACARLGALNMHGSLLPRYRGRAPVNWAVLHGERETGASLHYMVAKPDAGDLVAQTAVPILDNDTAAEVFDKVTVAAELTLWRALPGLLAEGAPRLPLDLAAGSYFGGRKPDDGRLRFGQGAAAVHNLVRAVAPPYPGAFFELGGQRFELLETRPADAQTDRLCERLRSARGSRATGSSDALPAASTAGASAWLIADDDRLFAVWPDTAKRVADKAGRRHGALELRDLRHDGQRCDARRIADLLGELLSASPSGPASGFVLALPD